MTALETKPIDEITAEDVRAFVAGRDVPESQTLEFKQEARSFALRRSICALANAYGGTFVAGVVERDHVAVELLLIENCVEQANRVGQSLADGLSPPIVGLRVRGVPIEGEAGVIVVRVPASPRRPHAASKQGEGEALYVFVRRGLESRPVGMREVQDMTLAATTQRQRALDRIAALKAPVLAARRDAPEADRPSCQVLLCAVPETSVSINRIDRRPGLQSVEVEFPGPRGQIVWRRFAGAWRTAFQSLRMDFDWGECTTRAAVHADGGCEFLYSLKAQPPEGRDPRDQAVYLGWVLGMYVSLILTCERIRRAVEEPELVFVVGAVITCDSGEVPLRIGGDMDMPLGTMARGVFDHDLVALANDDDVQQILNSAVANFFTLAGRAGPEADQLFDLTAVRQAWGLG